jgi:membrane-associated phospholipid phosphatase
MPNSLILFDKFLSEHVQLLAQFLPNIWKLIAVGGVYSVPIFLVWYWFVKNRLIALRATVSGLIAWFGFSKLISYFVIRERPVPISFLNFPSREIIFDRPGPSFPSDHAAFMTAIIVSFYLSGEKKMWPYMAFITGITLFARIVTAQHWIGDILVGMLIGSLASWLVYWLRRPIDRWILNPVINNIQRIGL